MAIKNLSSSFAGPATKSMSDVEREIESRTRAKDVFKDDSNRPGTSDADPQKQEKLDWLNSVMHQIKPIEEKTDMAEEKKEKIDGPESFHNEVEKRMMKLGSEKQIVKVESEYQKDDQYNPEDEKNKNKPNTPKAYELSK